MTLFDVVGHIILVNKNPRSWPHAIIRADKTMIKDDPVVVIAGPTAVGKTDYAIDLALKISGEIISADSMQIYQEMDLGTAKPSAEQRRLVPHHLIDIIRPDEDFSAADFVRLARAKIEEIRERGQKPLIGGGTGLYLRSLIRGFSYSPPPKDEAIRRQIEIMAQEKGGGSVLAELNKVDPETARRLHANDLKRIIRALEVYKISGIPLAQYKADKIGADRQSKDTFNITILDRPKEILRQRIDDRVKTMFDSGLVEEVKTLLKKYPPDLNAFQAIGYKETIDYLLSRGEKDLPALIALVQKHSRQFAKRQLTWFRSFQQAKWLEL